MVRLCEAESELTAETIVARHSDFVVAAAAVGFVALTAI